MLTWTHCWRPRGHTANLVSEGLVRVWLTLRFMSVEASCLRTWLGLAGLPVVEQRSLGGRASSQRGAVLQLWWLAILPGP